MAEAWENELDWEDDLSRPDGYPLAAMLLGAGFLVIVAVVLLGFSGLDIVNHKLLATGGAIVLAVSVWLAAWFLTLRHTAIGWKIGSGAVFGGLAIGAVVITIGMAAVSVQVDAAMMRAIRINGAGEPELPPGTRPGPITQSGMAFLHDMIAEHRRRQGVMVGLGMDRLADAGAVIAEPGLLRDCGRFARSRGEIGASNRRIAGIAQHFRDRISAIVADGRMRAAMIKDFDTGYGTGSDDLKAMSDLQSRQLDQAGVLCTFLAGHRWRPQGGMFMFGDQAGLAEFNRVIGQWNGLVGEEQRLLARSNARMRATGMIDDRSRID